MATTHAGHAPARGAAHVAHGEMGRHHYARLLMMTALSFMAMYVLMYAMVATIDHIYLNINKAYMAALMAAPMVPIELALMGAMYRNRRLNALLIAASVLAMAALWAVIRAQGGVGNEQFLRSMIPHHSSAILMCERASIGDPEIRALCRGIVKSQASEIRQMKAMLEERGR
jgi:uncharacterized protein (DUF305 family)